MSLFGSPVNSRSPEIFVLSIPGLLTEPTPILFPGDFMFSLTEEEIELLVSHFVIPSKQHLGGAKPFAFTETGDAMLSSVLKSKRARDMNIAIMRTFVALRKAAIKYTGIREELQSMKERIGSHSSDIEQIYKYLKNLEEVEQEESEQNERRQIGYRKPEK